jgi:short-subunit dehydrogenase
MPRPPLDGTILITGASSGIGRELARQGAGRARAVVLVARRAERLAELRAELLIRRPELVVSVQPCDLSDRASIDGMVAAAEREAGPIDVLVNNAGLGDMGFFDLSAWDKHQQMIATNITALTYLTHRLLPAMRARGRGGVLNVSSGFGLEFMPAFAVYAATKHYVTALTEALRCELAGSGVVMSQLCPGPVRTEFEEVAGNFTGKRPPTEMTAEDCARIGLRGFARGRALIVPGLLIKLALLVGALTPRWLKRWLYGIVAPRMRAALERALAAPGKV